MAIFKGAGVAIVTPMTADGEVNYEVLGEMLEAQIAGGTDAVIICGTTGESATMSDSEDLAVAECVVQRVAGRVPVIGGAGSNCTGESLRKGLELQKLGVDGLLLITPYYNKSNEEGIYHHLADVMDAVNLPCVLYNIPGRTGCRLSLRNVERLSRHPNAWGIKEASGDISYATGVARLLSDDFRMMSGNDDMIVPLMSLGASGVISVWADVAPRTVHDLCASFLAGDVAAARKAQLDNLELVHALFCEVNPVPVKAALAKMGLLEENYRRPLWPMADADRERLYRAMEGAGLLG